MLDGSSGRALIAPAEETIEATESDAVLDAIDGRLDRLDATLRDLARSIERRGA